MIIGTSYFVGSIVMFAFTARYIYFEIKSLGVREMFRNRMVMLTLAGAISHVICFLTYPFYFFPTYGLEIGLPNDFFLSFDFYVSNLCLRFIFLMVGLLTHISLVYMRSKAVLQSSTFILNAMKVLVFLFFVTELTTTVLACVITSYTVNNITPVTLISAYEPISASVGVFFTLIDVISTIRFAGYVQSLKGSGRSLYLTNMEHMKKTSLIAKRGFVICFTALVSNAFYWGYYMVLKLGGEAWFVEYMILVNQVVWIVVIVLWMWLRMDLDLISEKLESKEAVLLPVSTKERKIKSAEEIKFLKTSKINGAAFGKSSLPDQSLYIRETYATQRPFPTNSLTMGRISPSNSSTLKERTVEQPSNSSSIIQLIGNQRKTSMLEATIPLKPLLSDDNKETVSTQS
jgi:hypothetical protein